MSPTCDGFPPAYDNRKVLWYNGSIAILNQIEEIVGFSNNWKKKVSGVCLPAWLIGVLTDALALSSVFGLVLAG
jgi:hypothetical protein